MTDHPAPADVELALARGSADSLPAVVRLAFESLEQLERGSLELAHGGGLNVLEIAAALDRPAGDIRRALRDGLLRLGTAARRDSAPHLR
jgi:DNA-directed RNA polymerase specialized sigma24 family protein